MARNSTKKKQLFIQVQVQQQQQQPLVQQQHGQRVAKSIEKELERNQYEKDRKSTGSSKASRKQPPPPPPPKMSLHEHLYKDPIDYTGEHLIEAFRYEPILKSNDDYMELYLSLIHI